MFAMLLAGGIPGEQDPLFPYTRGKPKALIDVAGKPMVRWVLEALEGSDLIDAIVLTGIEVQTEWGIRKPLHNIPDYGDIIRNALHALQFIRDQNLSEDQVLVVAGDIPALTSEMIDWRCQRALEMDADLSFLAIERGVMEARFPGSDRSYLRVQDHELCGGDCHAVRVTLIGQEALWQRFAHARKSPLRQAAMVGYGTLLGLLTRRLDLPKLERRVSNRLGIDGRVSLSPYAELGMDVDKPHQLAILRRHLATSQS